ncbi:MAG: DNA-3-methyladenine glycosylase 2 family protein [Alphaproteobacteria bacterium]|nr:DNA-3-methyladenine glycosylase 2 family protein [Alphaproteobacteria bacterium]
MTRRRKNPHEAILTEGVAALCARDPDLARIVDIAGPPPPREREPGFGALLRIIIGQQVSAKAADALWRRTVEQIDPLTPTAVAAADEVTFRACGFSRQKIVYARHLAAEVMADRLDFASFNDMDDASVTAALTRLKGIGPWSAEIYLLFALGRPDVWPIGDLAVQIAVKRIKRLRSHPSPKRMTRIGEAWRPWRSAAAMLLWHAYAKLPVD